MRTAGRSACSSTSSVRLDQQLGRGARRLGEQPAGLRVTAQGGADLGAHPLRQHDDLAGHGGDLARPRAGLLEGGGDPGAPCRVVRRQPPRLEHGRVRRQLQLRQLERPAAQRTGCVGAAGIADPGGHLHERRAPAHTRSRPRTRRPARASAPPRRRGRGRVAAPLALPWRASLIRDEVADRRGHAQTLRRPLVSRAMLDCRRSATADRRAGRISASCSVSPRCPPQRSPL